MAAIDDHVVEEAFLFVAIVGCAWLHAPCVPRVCQKPSKTSHGTCADGSTRMAAIWSEIVFSDGGEEGIQKGKQR